MFETLFSSQGQVLEIHLTTFSKIVLALRKSHFPGWCYVLDVRTLVPPVAKISCSKNKIFLRKIFILWCLG